MLAPAAAIHPEAAAGGQLHAAQADMAEPMLMDEPPYAGDAEGEDADMAQPTDMDDADALPPLQDPYPDDAAADIADADALPPLQDLYPDDAAAADDDWAGEEEPLNECAHSTQVLMAII